MNDITLFKTKSRATYCHSTKKNQFLLIHPILNYLLSLHKQGIEVKKHLDNLKSDILKIEGYDDFPRQEWEYYYKKYKLLVENGYLESIDTKKAISGRLTAESIKLNLANTSQVTFEVTDSCNLKCDYCGYGKFYNKYDQRVEQRLSVKTAKNILNYLLDYFNSPLNKSQGRPISISFYGGEPLLNFQFIKEIISYLKEELPSQKNLFTFGMTTNAVLLDKYMDFLAKHNFRLLISLDGNKANNGYRIFPNGKPAFPTIIKNIRALKDKYPEYFDKRVNFNSVLHKKNSVSDIHQFFKKEFGKIPRISQLDTSGIAPEMQKEFWKTYKNFRESLREIEDYSHIEKDMFVRFPDAKETMSTIFRYSGFVWKRPGTLLFPTDQGRFIPTGTCSPFALKVFVLANGKILPCERIGHQFGLGYVDEEKVKIDFEKIAEKYNNYYDKLMKQCTKCYTIRNCKQCIFYLDIDSNNPACKGCMNETDFSNYFSARMSYFENHPELYKISMKEVFTI